MRSFVPHCLILCLCIFHSLNVTAQINAFKGTYPETRTTEQTDSLFGVNVSDPYRWLEVDTADETRKWVQEQNKVTQNYLADIPFRSAIKDRLTSLWNYEKFSLPFKEGAYTYFFKNDGLQNHWVLYRQSGSNSPEIFINPNNFSADGTTSLAEISFSKDGSHAAYQISEGGSDWRKVIVMNALNKKQLGDTLVDVKFAEISWYKNEGFFYSSYDKPKDGSDLSGTTEQHKLFYHQLGTSQHEDRLIFGGNATPRRSVYGQVTEDQQYLQIWAANSTTNNELYLIDLSKGKDSLIEVVKGYENEQYVVLSDKGKLFILTNSNAPNRKLVVTDASTPTSENWKVVIAESKFPLSVTTSGGKLFAQYLKDAVSEVVQYDLAGKKERTIDLPGLGTVAGFEGRKEEKEVYYSFTSYLYPTTIFKYNVITKKSSVYKKAGIRFSSDEYESKQVFYTSKDGTKVPMMITHKKGLSLNGKNPVLLYGYGGFNVSVTPSFNISNILFLENGGIYAVPNIRGGGEYGDAWHLAGTKMKRQNVFDDFIAAAEYLIKEKYTSSDYLAIHGGSNGGLLVGACMTQRPELFRVSLPAVGVMDMLRYHKFTIGAAWSYDYGTADDSKEMLNYLYKYSPVHNLKKGTCYPATMVTTADHDDRVVPAHSFKFGAALQAAQSCNNPVLMRIQTNSGHGAGKPTTMIIEEQTDKWAFLFFNMGLEYVAPK